MVYSTAEWLNVFQSTMQADIQARHVELLKTRCELAHGIFMRLLNRMAILMTLIAIGATIR